MTIGERLRFLRLRNNLTQEELGNRIGVKKQTIVKNVVIKIGRYKPKLVPSVRVEMRFVIPLSKVSLY
jgi:DNA-binding XRE family transcriptional regulator